MKSQSKKLLPKDKLWLAILKREKSLRGKTVPQVRVALKRGKFPKVLIDRFISEKYPH